MLAERDAERDALRTQLAIRDAALASTRAERLAERAAAAAQYRHAMRSTQVGNDRANLTEHMHVLMGVRMTQLNPR